jgi:hypothetical protein
MISENYGEPCTAIPLAIANWKRTFAGVGNLYCRVFHRSISRPVRGKYHCWKCQREFKLEW